MDFIYTLFGTPLGYIMWFFYQIIPSYVFALVMFTIVSRAVLFPLSIRQHKASIKQSIFTPRINELRRKYANDRVKQQEEMQKLYTEEGMKMSTGCSTSLIQLPIFFGLIDVVYKPLTHLLHASQETINKAIEITQGILGDAFNATTAQIGVVRAVQESPEKFTELGSDFVQSASNINMNLFGIDLGAVPTMAFNLLLIIPIFAGLTTIVQSYLSTKLNPAFNADPSSARMSKIMMYAMAFLFVSITFSVPAGVGLYWSIANILMIVQQLVLNKLYNPKKLRAVMVEEIEARKKAKKKSAIKVVKNDAGEEVEISQKELDKIRLAKARKLDAERYGDDESSEEDN